MRTFIIILLLAVCCFIVREAAAQDPDLNIDKYGLIVEPDKNGVLSGFITDDFHIGIHSKIVILRGRLTDSLVRGDVILPRQTITDSMGFYEFGRLGNGVYNVIIEGSNGEDLRGTGEIKQFDLCGKNKFINIIVP